MMEIVLETTIPSQGLHSKMYERPNPSGSGRYVVKESVLPSVEQPQMFVDRSRIAIRNKYHAIQFVRQHTTIPVPKIVKFRDEPGLPVQIVMEYVENAQPAHLVRMGAGGAKLLKDQIRKILLQLHFITDPKCRSFAGIPLFAHRFEATHIPIQDLLYRQYESDSPYVLCHGDLAWHNILIDPDTFEIKCLLDWEYAGFYPVEVEGDYWKRRGALGRMRGTDPSDVDRVLRILYSHQHEVEQSSMLISSKNEIGIEGSELRNMLRNIRLPPDSTACVGTILGGGIDYSRKRIGDALRDISNYLTVDHDTVEAVIHEVSGFDNGLPRSKVSVISIDRAQLRELSSTLPKAFSTLATEFESSGSPFVSLIQHFSAEADNVFQLEKVEQLHPLPETEESRQEDDVVRRGREMKGERRNLADEAFRTSEIQKWNALEKFAENILRLSAAAKSLYPYLADYDQDHLTAKIDFDRAWAEYRAKNIREDVGTGGWKIKVEDDEPVVRSMKEDFRLKWEETSEQRATLLERLRIKRVGNELQFNREDNARVAMREKSRLKSENGGVSPLPEVITRRHVPIESLKRRSNL